MSDYMLTYSKVSFAPLNPKEGDVHIEDIAHALSLMTRANGHLPEFFSVAQHCILCCEEAIAREHSRRVALACLLHDASEAYIADIIRPVKKNLSDYLKIEKRLQDIIYHKFFKEELTSEEGAQVKAIDDALLYCEFDHYMDEQVRDIAPIMGSKVVFGVEPFEVVEKKFLKLFYELIIE